MKNVNDNSKKTNDGGPAFPLAVDINALWQKNDGMNLRDYFAAAALTGILADPQKTIQVEALSRKQDDDAFISKTNAALAYCYADAMIAERDKGGL